MPRDADLARVVDKHDVTVGNEGGGGGGGGAGCGGADGGGVGGAGTGCGGPSVGGGGAEVCPVGSGVWAWRLCFRRVTEPSRPAMSCANLESVKRRTAPVVVAQSVSPTTPHVNCSRY